MPRTFPDVVVTNTGQPQVVQIEPVAFTVIPQGLNIQIAAAATVTIAPVAV